MSTKGSSMDRYKEAAYAGCKRGLFGMPFEHPFDALKTNMQATQSTRTIATAKYLFQKKGIWGYYSGFIPNSMRAASKQAYRFPLRLSLDSFYESVIPQFVTKKFVASTDLATALTIANLEVFIINPMEKAKVHVMTDKTGDIVKCCVPNPKAYSLILFFKLPFLSLFHP